MIRLPPRSTRTDTLFPDTTLFRAGVPQCVGLLRQQSIVSRDFRDVGAGFKTRRDDPCLGLGRPAPPRRPCWNDVHTRGPLTLLPFETCFECSYFISHYDTPQTRGKHSQISAYENVGRFLRLRYRGYSVPVDESRMAVSNAAVAAPSSCAAPQWQRSFSRSLSRRKRFEQVGCELAQGHIAIGCNRQRIKAGGLRDRRRLRPGPQEFVHPIEASRASSPEIGRAHV